MYGKVYSIGEDVKKASRRIDTLKLHIEHSENFKKYRGNKTQYEKLYAQYKTLKKATGFGAERKAQKALDDANEYYELFRPQLAMFENAEKYLRDVLQSRFDPKKLPPVTKWREELTAKTAEREGLYREYRSLKDETAKVEKIRRSVHEIVDVETRRAQPTRARGMDI